MDFQDTMPLGGGRPADPSGTAPAPAAHAGHGGHAGHADGAAPAGTASSGQTLAIRFTGSGSEYFRIWIVNLLLTLVTLSLYLPFAKARRLRYFHGNTFIGEHALGFHGDPWKMLRGYLLVLVLSLAYAASVRLAPTVGAVAVVIFAALWPAMWCASLRFRLANSSWRGLRMQFTGRTGDAYRAMSPVLLPMTAFVLLTVLMQPDKPGAEPPPAAAIGLLLAMLAATVLGPMGLAWIKRYQHGHYGFAGEQARCDLRTSKVYGITLVAMLIGLLLLGALVAVGLVVGFTLVALGSGREVIIGLTVVAVLAFYAGLFFVVQPYAAAQLQNASWNATRSVHVRFESQLGFRALAGLTLRNLLLTIVTLGLYRPFAAVNTARLRLQAVQLQVQGDIEQWQGRARRMDDATGDAAGDMLGIDLGL